MSSLQKALLGAAAALAMTMAGVGARAQNSRRAGSTDKLQPMDLFHLQWDANPEISPDGSRIVYERHFADVLGDRWHSNLWIVNFDGSGDRPLTTGDFNDSRPRWSPDGKRLAYLSNRGGKTQIYVRWMDTGQTAKLTDLAYPPAGISWSPDGRRIAFTSFVPGPPTTLARIPHAPAGAKWAARPLLADKLIWRANGRGMVPNGHSQIFVVGADGAGPVEVSHGDYNFGGRFGGGSLVWTRDGKDLIFSADLRPGAQYKPNSEVYEMSVADGQWKALTSRFGPDNSPALSPDGTKIAYTGYDERYQGHQTAHLYVMNRDGSGSHMLMSGFDHSIKQPRWASDGSGLYFIYENHGDTKLAFATTFGARKILANHLGTDNTTYDLGASFSVASNGRFAVAYTLPDLPGSVAAGSAKESASVKVVANPNREFLAHKKLGRTTEFTYTSSYDGKSMQGWIIKPPDFTPGHKYPLILEIHGGPYMDYGDRFDTEKQLYVAQGYVVLYVNPRGSTSYGEKFGNLIHNDYPDHDFEDLNSGVDAAIKMGFVDPSHLYVTGGSGGGVLTCWVVDHTARFRAAMSMYPVTDWYSWALTADAGPHASNHWFPGPPWEHWQLYMERSPINLVGHVKTPTALMTGLVDYRTPISQAEEFYEALKMRKIPTILIRVPGEPHAIHRRPSHQMTKVLETLAWFDRYK